MVDEVKEETELQKLHKKLKELEDKATPIIVKGYLKLKSTLSKYINKYPVIAAWTSGIFGAGLMYIVRPWLPS